jgi:hypothetical protein
VAPKSKFADALSLSEIQTFSYELKLQVLEETDSFLGLKRLVNACLDFHPVYCKNKGKMLSQCSLERSAKRGGTYS